MTCSVSIVAVLAATAVADLPDPIESKISSVTVYRDQARVVREFKVPANPTLQVVHIAGLPKQFIESSAFIETDANASARSLQIIPTIDQADDDALIKDLEGLQKKRKVAEQSLKVVEQDMLTLEKLVQFASGKVQQNMERATLDVQSVTALAEFTIEKRRKLADELFKHQTEVDSIDKQIAGKETQIAKQTETTSAYGALISVLSPGGGVVRLTYDVAGASWTPRYKIHASNLQVAEPKFKIHLDAQVFQSSGENWNDVQLTLSTATPHSNAARPLLTPLRVNAAPVGQAGGAAMGQFDGTDSFARGSWVDEQLVALNVQLNSSAGLRQIKELTSSAEVQREIAADASDLSSDESYELKDRVSLPNSATAQTVAILNHDASGEYYRVVTPLLSSFAFREALLLNDTGQSLIAGAADVYQENQFVGRIKLPPTAAGQKVTVGFGTDRQVRTRRELLSRSDAVKGGNKQASLKYRLVVSNFHDKPVKVRLLERMPIAAKDNMITVTLSEQEAARLSEDPLYRRMLRPAGILRWDLEIPAQRFGSDAFDHEYEFSVELDRQQTIVGDSVAGMQQDVRYNKVNNGGGFGGGGGVFRVSPENQSKP